MLSVHVTLVFKQQKRVVRDHPPIDCSPHGHLLGQCGVAPHLQPPVLNADKRQRWLLPPRWLKQQKPIHKLANIIVDSSMHGAVGFAWPHSPCSMNSNTASRKGPGFEGIISDEMKSSRPPPRRGLSSSASNRAKNVSLR
eukprot:scaffold95203_cov32-Prasinocladus_malaysianus.AAC.3